jgi:hypothetical protein
MRFLLFLSFSPNSSLLSQSRWGNRSVLSDTAYRSITLQRFWSTVDKRRGIFLNQLVDCHILNKGPVQWFYLRHLTHSFTKGSDLSRSIGGGKNSVKKDDNRRNVIWRYLKSKDTINLIIGLLWIEWTFWFRKSEEVFDRWATSSS